MERAADQDGWHHFQALDGRRRINLDKSEMCRCRKSSLQNASAQSWLVKYWLFDMIVWVGMENCFKTRPL